MSPAPAHSAQAAVLAALTMGLPPGHRLRLNRNRRTLISLRGQSDRTWTVSIHPVLLDQPGFLGAALDWVKARGHGRHPALLAALAAAGRSLAPSAAPIPEPPPVQELGDARDLAAHLDQVHGTWFADLVRPAIRWSRGVTPRRLRTIRFGSYRRAGRGHPAEIRIHPRLDQPWIAREFLHHVLFHELCHHRQACAPLRGEPIHSQRFRQWERDYPHHQTALAWERARLVRLLGREPPAP